MLGSRLRRRRNQRTFDITNRSGTTITTSRMLTWQQPSDDQEIITPEGGVQVITDIFFDEPAPGETLPAYAIKQIMTETSTGYKYEILRTGNQGGNSNRLTIEARRLGWSVG